MRRRPAPQPSLARHGTRARVARWLVVVSLSCGVVLPQQCTPVASASPSTTPAETPTAVGAAHVYFRSSRSFLALKRVGGRGFDWSDNGCSVPTSLRLSVPALEFISQVFVDVCAQHDFAYRNFGGALRLDPTPLRRRQVDRHFYSLMRTRCRSADIRRRHRVLLCRFYAQTFYRAVRAFGRFTPSRVTGLRGTSRSRGSPVGPVQ